jgi:hypothetical protein
VVRFVGNFDCGQGVRTFDMMPQLRAMLALVAFYVAGVAAETVLTVQNQVGALAGPNPRGAPAGNVEGATQGVFEMSHRKSCAVYYRR